MIIPQLELIYNNNSNLTNCNQLLRVSEPQYY